MHTACIFWSLNFAYMLRHGLHAELTVSQSCALACTPKAPLMLSQQIWQDGDRDRERPKQCCCACKVDLSRAIALTSAEFQTSLTVCGLELWIGINGPSKQKGMELLHNQSLLFLRCLQFYFPINGQRAHRKIGSNQRTRAVRPENIND